MAENLTIAEPDFDLIEKEAGNATRNAVATLWAALNFESQSRRLGVRRAQEMLAPKVLSDAPGSQQDNYDLLGASILLLTGSSNRTFTGFRAPDPGQSRILVVHVVGSATYTFAHAHASSDAENRLRLQSGVDTTVATDRSITFLYLNTLWRELKAV